jgi:LAO/AO transport system kinase
MQADFAELTSKLASGDTRALARAITLVENEQPGFARLLESLDVKNTPVIGFTGAPGAGKSSLVNAVVDHLEREGKKIAVLMIDPSSPFNRGAFLGDRLRMAGHFLSQNVFMRSMATRGSMGGLAPKVFEVADVLKAAPYDYILIETVGIGQSETEIAALADTTVLVLTPEAGDDIQTSKSGVMEIADIYVVNKADREGADTMYRNLAELSHRHATTNWEIPVIKTVATQDKGIDLLLDAIAAHMKTNHLPARRLRLLAAKAGMMIRALKTRNLDDARIEEALKAATDEPDFNLYRFVKTFAG